MLRITGVNEKALKEKIERFLSELKINAKSLKIDENGFFISGHSTLYRGTPEFEGGVLRLEENNQQPALLLAQIKEDDSTAEIIGSLEFGDDNYHKMFYFSSEAGSNDVKTDYALGSTDLHDAIGYPASESAYLYTSHSMYGEEVFGIQSVEDFKNAGSVVKAFLHFIQNSSDKKLAKQWEKFTDQDLDFDGWWTDLYAADGSCFKMSQAFLSDFIEKYNVAFPDNMIDKDDNASSEQDNSKGNENHEYDIMEMLEAEMSPEDISEVTGIPIDEIYELISEME